MSNVYIINPDGSTHQMPRAYCKSETEELQDLLERNPDLLPGDQINPEDPRRWLLIKREMPVPDPSTGADRWNVDFFLADQDGIPTFVECKRFKDTRSRREIIGQVLEYAANAHYYWTKETIEQYAEETARDKGSSLEESLHALQPTNEETAELFFERIKQNLREGQIRVIFFLEDSPFELRSVVDFLNRQMERSEVLLVEAKLFDKDGYRVVVPSLFGYTEEARRVKRAVNVTTPSARRRWDEQSFFEDASGKIDEASNQTLRQIHEFGKTPGCEVRWGTGAINGSFSLVCPSISTRSFLTVWSHGGMQWNFGWLNGSQAAEEFRDRFKEMLSNRLGFDVPEDYASKYINCPLGNWAPRIDAFVEAFGELLVNS